MPASVLAEVRRQLASQVPRKQRAQATPLPSYTRCEMGAAMQSCSWLSATARRRRRRPPAPQALAQPATTLLAVFLCCVFALLHALHLGYADVGLSYSSAMRGELWRCGEA